MRIIHDLPLECVGLIFLWDHGHNTERGDTQPLLDVIGSLEGIVQALAQQGNQNSKEQTKDACN